MLHENLDKELLPYWLVYKEAFKKINKAVRFCIREIGYGVFDSDKYVIQFSDIEEIIEKYSDDYFNELLIFYYYYYYYRLMVGKN